MPDNNWKQKLGTTAQENKILKNDCLGLANESLGEVLNVCGFKFEFKYSYKKINDCLTLIVFFFSF